MTEEHADAGAETDRPEGAAASGGAAEGGRLADGLEIRPGPSFEPPPDRRLYLVGGKGGVGKSTVAASLAITLVEDAGRRLLLLGVDPAGSLGDIFDLPIGDDPTPVPGVSGLTIRQLDPGRGWASLRDRYRTEVDHFFAGLLAGGGSASLDREVAERLIDLAPPGLDELVAIMEVIDSTEDRGYDALVLDAAPTGHLLRLLELPELGLDWCHAMLRLLLKYRGVVPLSGLGERVLELSRDLRRVRAWLSDPDRTWFLAVALPESLSLPESRRLLEGLAGLKMRPGALLVNRALDGQGRVSPDAAELAGALLSIDPTVPGALAPLAVTPLRGVAALREFAGAWRCAARDPAGGPAG